MFGKKTIRVEYRLAEAAGQFLGYDEMKPAYIPLDLDFPAWVEIDGKRYEVVSMEPGTRKAAARAGVLKVALRSAAADQGPSVFDHTSPEALEGHNKSQSYEHTTSAEEPNPESHTETKQEIVLPVALEMGTEVEMVMESRSEAFEEASCANLAPRVTGKRGDYHWVEVPAWKWRQVEFVRRDQGPEIGEEMAGIQQVKDSSLRKVGEDIRYANQYVRELTQFPLRGLQESDTHLQASFFPFATRKDGVALKGSLQNSTMTGEGYVDCGFAYVLPSGLALYGQEFEERMISLAVTIFGEMHPSYLDEDVEALCKMMRASDLVLVDWTDLEAIEPNEKEMRDYLERYFV